MLFVLSLMALAGSASASVLPDPTRPPTAQSGHSKPVKPRASRPRWVLSSTLVSAQRRTAVINGRVVSVGERVNGARVMEIQPHSVRLRRRGRDITLVMLKKDVKKPSRSGTP